MVLINLWIFSFSRLASFCGTSSLIFISARPIGNVPVDCSSLITFKTKQNALVYICFKIKEKQTSSAYFKSLLLRVFSRINRKVSILHCLLNHGHGIGSLRFGIYTFVRYYGGYFLETIFLLLLSLFVGNLKLSFF